LKANKDLSSKVEAVSSLIKRFPFFKLGSMIVNLRYKEVISEQFSAKTIYAQ